MPANELLANNRLRFVGPSEQVDERAVVLVEQAVGVLLSRERHLVELLAQLHARLAIHLHELEHAPKRRLLLARHQMGANAKLIDHVALVSSSLKLQNITSFLGKKVSEDYAYFFVLNQKQ